MSTEFVMEIMANQIICNDPNYKPEVNLYDFGSGYKPVKVYYQTGDVKKEYKRAKGEGKHVNKQTLPRLVLQIFEEQIDALTEAERLDFLVSKGNSNDKGRRGIFKSKDEFKEKYNTIEYTSYKGADDLEKYVVYAWGLFSDVAFSQTCLQKFGKDGDKFVISYTEEDKKDNQNQNQHGNGDNNVKLDVAKPNYVDELETSNNIILRGAPGTGKTYLAHQIAAYIASDGATSNYKDVRDEQIAFVQFHPSYDYTDFVEGLRPALKDDGTMGFELKDGVFKEFVSRARKNWEDSHKDDDVLERELNRDNSIKQFLESVDLGGTEFETTNKNKFYIVGFDDKHIIVSVPQNPVVNSLVVKTDELRKMIDSDKEFNAVKDVTTFFEKKYATQGYSYLFALYKEINKKANPDNQIKAEKVKEKKYVFIIDEINRGEISKIFGELFFSVDPGYRGEDGSISTQYSNLHDDPNEKFYIPKNVYIIGTMNDIDRSVDTFDFAMRRRFRFIEVTAEQSMQMLDNMKASKDEPMSPEKIQEIKNRMKHLNEKIITLDGANLNVNYQIGAAYFKKLEENKVSEEKLWSDFLQPLLSDYLQGMPDDVVENHMQALKEAFDKTSNDNAKDSSATVNTDTSKDADGDANGTA